MLLKGTVKHPNGPFEITLDTETGAFTADRFFDYWFKPMVEVRDGRTPVDRTADPERWLRALARSLVGRNQMTIEEVG